MSETIAEDVHMDETLEYPFQYFEEPPTLQEMASSRFCQHMWHAQISSSETPLMARLNDDAELNRHRRRIDSLVKNLNLPKPIEEMLERGASHTCCELKRLISHLRKITQFAMENAALEVDMDWCVWSPYGDVDLVQSVTNVLNSDRLNEAGKFFILSKFCMEDEMKKYSSRSLVESVQNREFNTNSLQFYWVCYLRKELDRIPLNGGGTLDRTMAYVCESRREIYGLEYFWHRLGNDDQIALAKRILSGYLLYSTPEWNFIERLLRHISLSSTECLANESAKYLQYSLIYSRWSQHQLRIWRRFKDQILDSAVTDMIAIAFEGLIASEDRMRMLVGIWDTAHDRHKQLVADHDAGDIISCITDRTPCLAAIDLLWRIIMRIPENERLKFTKRHVDKLAGTIQLLEALRKMLNVCLPSTDDQSQFKNTLSQSAKLKQTCVSFLEQSKHADLDASLEWLFSDRGPDAVNDFKKVILTMMAWKYTSSIQTLISSIPKWNETCQFIDETYSGDERSAVEMKRMFVDEATSLKRNECTSFRQHFDIARQIVEEVVPAHDLPYFKRIRLFCLGTQLRNGEYWNHERPGDEIFLENFVKWCCDSDEESISEFKKSIPFDAILNGILTHIQVLLPAESNVEASLPRFDRYLKWLVGSDERVRECKLRAIEHCSVDVGLLKVARPSYQYLALVTMLLMWLCDDDEEAVRKVRMERLEMQTQ